MSIVPHLIVLGPTALLSATGIVFVSRRRSMPTVLMASGFLAGFVTDVCGAFVSTDISTRYSAGRDLAIASFRWPSWLWFTHYVGIAGTWVGAAALLWYALASVEKTGRPAGSEENGSD